ncbi:MAG: hypothetical protein CM1200mP40_18000 [Gammaproteobacteria bacterium]|nr:MAG: hypothetical protein CM1200mP40_18000 [Gammaproteobacteria bacterium]
MSTLKVVQLGDEIDVMVLDIDEERRRISLGIKHATKILGMVLLKTLRRVTRFRGTLNLLPFLESSLVRRQHRWLVHLSDIPWDEPGEEQCAIKER